MTLKTKSLNTKYVCDGDGDGQVRMNHLPIIWVGLNRKSEETYSTTQKGTTKGTRGTPHATRRAARCRCPLAPSLASAAPPTAAQTSSLSSLAWLFYWSLLL